MGRLMKYQMEHIERKLRAIVDEKSGHRPQCDYERPEMLEFGRAYLKGKVKITPVMLRAAFAKYVAEEESRGYNNHTVAENLVKAYYAKDKAAADKALKKDTDAWNKRRAIIEAARDVAFDKIVLGGEENALAAVEAFASLKV